MKFSTPELIRQRSDQYLKQMQSANPNAGYTMQNRTWPGMGKVIEEAGEVLQLCGKIMSIRGATTYFNGEDLRKELQDELGDLLASVKFLIEENKLDRNAIETRAISKGRKYADWKATNQ
jgi:NTP pyrophosphatase (non-canonical NTP hydrolase)